MKSICALLLFATLSLTSCTSTEAPTVISTDSTTVKCDSSTCKDTCKGAVTGSAVTTFTL